MTGETAAEYPGRHIKKSSHVGSLPGGRHRVAETCGCDARPKGVQRGETHILLSSTYFDQPGVERIQVG